MMLHCDSLRPSLRYIHVLARVQPQESLSDSLIMGAAAVFSVHVIYCWAQ